MISFSDQVAYDLDLPKNNEKVLLLSVIFDYLYYILPSKQFNLDDVIKLFYITSGIDFYNQSLDQLHKILYMYKDICNNFDNVNVYFENETFYY